MFDAPKEIHGLYNKSRAREFSLAHRCFSRGVAGQVCASVYKGNSQRASVWYVRYEGKSGSGIFVSFVGKALGLHNPPTERRKMHRAKKEKKLRKSEFTKAVGSRVIWKNVDTSVLDVPGI